MQTQTLSAVSISADRASRGTWVQSEAQPQTLRECRCLQDEEPTCSCHPESSWAAAGHCVSDVPEDECRCLIARHHLLTRQGHAHTFQGARLPCSLMSHVKSRHSQYSLEKDQSGMTASFFLLHKNHLRREDRMRDFDIKPFHSGVFCQSPQAEQRCRVLADAEEQLFIITLTVHEATVPEFLIADLNRDQTVPDHGMLPSITQSVFGFAAISFRHRANPPASDQTLLVSAW